MYKYLGILFVLISYDLAAQEIPDYKGEYVFTNSRVSMKGIRELITHEEAGKRSIQFNAKFPLGRIKIISDLTSISDKLIHRGPDDFGTWTSKEHSIGLSHRRLSILDLSSAGKQPFIKL